VSYYYHENHLSGFNASLAESGLLAVTSNLEGSTPLTRRVIYDRQHALLEHLLNLVPTLPSSLAPLLVRNFPHKRQPQAAHVAYIRNLLRVTEYCSELSERVLGLIVDRALMVDVSVLFSPGDWILIARRWRFK
jgi:RNA polymerase I-specific transcription initiation factor RRN3